MGTGEVLLILVIALIIWGPARLVEIARTLGKIVYTLRKTASELTTAVTREIDLEKEHPSPSSQPDSSQRQSNLGRQQPGSPETTSPKDQP